MLAPELVRLCRLDVDAGPELGSVSEFFQLTQRDCYAIGRGPRWVA